MQFNVWSIVFASTLSQVFMFFKNDLGASSAVLGELSLNNYGYCLVIFALCHFLAHSLLSRLECGCDSSV